MPGAVMSAASVVLDGTATPLVADSKLHTPLASLRTTRIPCALPLVSGSVPSVAIPSVGVIETPPALPVTVALNALTIGEGAVAPSGAPASKSPGALVVELHGPHVGIDGVLVAHDVVTRTSSIVPAVSCAHTAPGSPRRPLPSSVQPSPVTSSSGIKHACGPQMPAPLGPCESATLIPVPPAGFAIVHVDASTAATYPAEKHATVSRHCPAEPATAAPPKTFAGWYGGSVVELTLTVWHAPSMHVFPSGHVDVAC